MLLTSALLLSAALRGAPGCPAAVRELRVRTPAGHVLAAQLALPATSARAPVVVMVSGAGPHDRGYSTTPAQADSILRLARAGGVRLGYCRRYPEHGHAFSGNVPRLAAAAPEVLDDLARFARLVLVAGRPPALPPGPCRREGAGTFGGVTITTAAHALSTH